MDDEQLLLETILEEEDDKIEEKEALEVESKGYNEEDTYQTIE